MKVETTPEAPRPATDRRAYLLASALRALRCAGSGRDVLKATADGVLLLSEVMQLDGPKLSEAEVGAVGETLRALLQPLADAVGAGASYQRVAVSIGATFQAFQLCCGSSERRNTITREEAAELGESMRWVRAALEELHCRRLLQSRGDALFRHAVGKLEFSHASLDGKPH